MALPSFIRDNAPFLAAGALLTFGSSFGQTYFISLFAGEIRAEFSLSHGAWGTIYMIGTLASAIVMVWAGTLTDIIRVRVLGAIVVSFLAAACLFMAAVPGSALLIVAVFFLRLGGQGMMSHMADVAMARWFVAARGKALAISRLGFAFGEALIPLTFVALLAVFDWRMLWLAAAAICILVLPLLVRLLRQERTPQSIAAEDIATGMAGRQWQRSEMLRHPLFWFLIPALLGPGAFNTAFFFQQVHFAEVKGWAHLELVSLFPVYVAVAIGTGLAWGVLIDRFGTGRLMPLYQAPMIIGFVVLGMTGTLWGALIGILFLAISQGGNSTIPAAFWAEFYGTRHLGAIKAMATAVMVLGSALGPGVTGLLIDRGVGIETQYIWIGGYFAVACVMTLLGISRTRPRLARAA